MNPESARYVLRAAQGIMAIGLDTESQQQIMKRMPPDQTPNLFIYGAKNQAFESEKPFTI